MVGTPSLSGTWPEHGATGVPLRPTIQLFFAGPGLIDPLSWTSGTFALYGPGDVVYQTGPGTILNSGIQNDPYTLIDGAVIRERIEGTFTVYVSGQARASGIHISGNLGAPDQYIIAEFTPSVPLNAYTDYTAVVVGDDGLAWSSFQQIFPGVTSWTSEAQFSGVVPIGSGVLNVLTPYSRTLPTALYTTASGYNDTYIVTITSGSTTGEPKFLWSKASAGTRYPSNGAGPHNLGEGLTFEFSGVFVSGDVYSLDVYVPQALANSFVWSFTTSTISGNTPPITPVEPSLIIDLTEGGGIAPSDTDATPLVLVKVWPDNLAYGVRTDLPLIMLQFNKPLLSGSLPASLLSIRCQALNGAPNVESTGTITPQSIEYSGVYLKLWL